MTEKRYFKVLIPSHSEGGKIYGKGDVVETEFDLNTMNGPNSKKFQEVDKPKQSSPVKRTISKTVK